MSLIETMFWYLGASVLVLIGLVLTLAFAVLCVMVCAISIPVALGYLMYTKFGLDFVTTFGVCIISLYPSYKLNELIIWLVTDYKYIIKKIKLRFIAKHKVGSIIKDDKFLYEILAHYDLRSDGVCYLCLRLNGIRSIPTNSYQNQFVIAEDDIVKDYGKLSKAMIKILFKDV